MLGNTKIVIGIIVVAVVIGIGYYWYSSTKPSAPVTTATNTQGTAAPAGPTLPSGTNTSNDALAQDVASVDADVSAMNGDTTAIDTGLSDKAVAQ